MDLLQAPERSVFYWFPVEDGCLWFQAIPSATRLSALRPSQFMNALDGLIASQRNSHARRDWF